MVEYLQIIIPAATSIIGFIVTYLSLKKQFLYSINTSMHEPRRRLYIQTYRLLTRTLDNREIVFSKDYEDRITETWVEISVYSESEVYKSFNRFYNYIKSIRKKYIIYCKEIDWEKYDIDEMGNRTPDFTQWDIDRYEYLEEKYREENQPQEDYLNTLIHSVLENIRNELKVDK